MTDPRSPALTAETLARLRALLKRLAELTDYPLECEDDEGTPTIYMHTRGEKCADGRHHTYMEAVATVSPEDWKDPAVPVALADLFVESVNHADALLSAAERWEQVRVLMDEHAECEIDSAYPGKGLVNGCSLLVDLRALLRAPEEPQR